MRRLPPFERVLIALLLPLWATCFALCVLAVLQRAGYPPLNVEAGVGSAAPIVLGFKQGMGGEESGLAPGDRLLSLRGNDLRGKGQIDLAVIFAGARGGEPLPSVYERGGVPAAAEIRAASYAVYWPRLPASLVFALTAVLLLARAAPSTLIRTVFGAYIAWALFLACTFAGGDSLTRFSIALQGGALAVGFALGIRSALVFPHGRQGGRLARFGPWLFASIGLFDVSRFYGTPFPREVGVVGETVLGLLATAVVCVTVWRTYRRSSAIERRQIKWVLLGSYAAVAPPSAIAILAAFDARFEPLMVSSVGMLILVPLSLHIAIRRYNLFDVDRLLSHTATFTLLACIGVGVLLGLGPHLANGIGVQPPVAWLAMSLLVTASVAPLQRMLRPWIDRVLFTEQHAVEEGFQTLLEELSGCGGPQDLAQLTALRLFDLFTPQSLVLYTRGDGVYAPALVLGTASPAEIDGNGAVIAALSRRSGPITSEPSPWRAPAQDPFARAAIASLGVPVVVPVRQSRELIAFLCMGSKRSGDVYTSTDLTMLSAVADKLASELRRFDEAEVLRQSRAMQDALRRYVPGAVADEIDRGGDLEAGEREISVLFVDIRNYTAYTQQRPSQEVFAAISRYTHTVSRIVREWGGSVVEFGGDGVMAIFGAPHDLDEKEHAAVCAAQQIVDAVAHLRLGGADTLSVGAGIATGRAYVGNVRSADRYIWTAIGNTTNLASRLQALTRDLAAAIIVDETTWTRAGDRARSFAPQRGVAVRGHSAPVDVWVCGIAA